MIRVFIRSAVITLGVVLLGSFTALAAAFLQEAIA